MNKDVHDPEQTRHRLRRNKSGEDEAAFESEGANAARETLAPFAIADQQETNFGATLRQGGRDGQKIVVTLELEQSGNFTHHEVIGCNSELGAALVVVARGQEGCDVEAAENAGVLLRAAD